MNNERNYPPVNEQFSKGTLRGEIASQSKLQDIPRRADLRYQLSQQTLEAAQRDLELKLKGMSTPTSPTSDAGGLHVSGGDPRLVQPLCVVLRALECARYRVLPGGALSAGRPEILGRVFNNVFVERLWRTAKYEDISLRDYGSVSELDAGLARYFRFYNEERPSRPGTPRQRRCMGWSNFDHRLPRRR